MSNWYDHYQILIFDHLDSTSSEAKRLAHIEDKNEYLIWTYLQTAGRGRQGKEWRSGPNDLTFSLLIRPKCNILESLDLVFIASICMSKAIEDLLGKIPELRLKWPNDIMLGDEKICGILLETATKTNSNNVNWIAIGIGVNIVSNPKLENPPFATNLLSKGKNILPDQLLNSFMKNFHESLFKWKLDGFENFRKIWLKYAYKLGEIVTITTDQDRIVGKFIDINEHGLLILELTNGEKIKISAGDLFFHK